MSSIQSRLPPIHCLLAFEARARLKSGVLVARELAITPSAVSHRIRQLEDFTNLQLFAKVNGETVLTSAGQSYLSTVRDALLSLSHFTRNSRTAPARTKLRLSSPPTFAHHVLMPRLSEFRARFPHIDLKIQVSVPLVGTKAEPADVEIRFGDGRYPDRHVRRLLDEQVTPLCSPDYLAKQGPFDRYEDLQRARLLRCSIEPWHAWFQTAGLDWPEPGGELEFSDVGMCVEAAAYGHGVALGRPMLVRGLVERGRLIPVFDLAAWPYYAFYATCAPQTLERPEVAGFIDWFEDSIAQALQAARRPEDPATSAKIVPISALSRRQARNAP